MLIKMSILKKITKEKKWSKWASWNMWTCNLVNLNIPVKILTMQRKNLENLTSWRVVPVAKLTMYAAGMWYIQCLSQVHLIWRTRYIYGEHNEWVWQYFIRGTACKMHIKIRDSCVLNIKAECLESETLWMIKTCTTFETKVHNLMISV